MIFTASLLKRSMLQMYCYKLHNPIWVKITIEYKEPNYYQFSCDWIVIVRYPIKWVWLETLKRHISQWFSRRRCFQINCKLKCHHLSLLRSCQLLSFIAVSNNKNDNNKGPPSDKARLNHLANMFFLMKLKAKRNVFAL